MTEVAIDELVRTKRKTLALVLNTKGELIVRAPLFTSLDYINKFIKKHSSWIIKKKEKINKLTPVIEKQFIDGEEFLYLGQKYKLRFVDNSKLGIQLNSDLELPKRFYNNAEQKITGWYKQQAKLQIEDLLKKRSYSTGIKYNSIKITSAKTRWGSCTCKGVLCFSWRLVMAPIDVIDYVVVHELVHIIQKDHSKKFWSKVEKIVPDYKDKRKWLKVNGRELTI